VGNSKSWETNEIRCGFAKFADGRPGGGSVNQNERLEKLADAVIPEAIEWIEELRAYRTYQGKNPEYFRKARIGVGIIGGAIRLCATVENMRTNELIQMRMMSAPGETKRLAALAAAD
jgi:hypothetical protein